jgi:succinate dehydrogenase / fumarate reductase cytochrome b subunit
VRIILVDFWEKGALYQRQMAYGVVGAFIVLFVPFAIRHLSNVFGN